MSRHIPFVALVASMPCLACTVQHPDPPAAARAPEAATSWQVSPRRFGPITLGTPLHAVSLALRESLTVAYDTYDYPCDYLVPRTLPVGTSLMVVSDTVVRVDVDTLSVPTSTGIRIGSPDGDVRAAYAGRVREKPHAYTSGAYLVVTPAGAADSAFRLVFETHDGRVTRFRAGRLPEVEWIEGCS
jgi:hypothetical protein